MKLVCWEGLKASMKRLTAKVGVSARGAQRGRYGRLRRRGGPLLIIMGNKATEGLNGVNNRFNFLKYTENVRVNYLDIQEQNSQNYTVISFQYAN